MAASGAEGNRAVRERKRWRAVGPSDVRNSLRIVHSHTRMALAEG